MNERGDRNLLDVSLPDQFIDFFVVFPLGAVLPDEDNSPKDRVAPAIKINRSANELTAGFDVACSVCFVNFMERLRDTDKSLLAYNCSALDDA